MLVCVYVWLVRSDRMMVSKQIRMVTGHFWFVGKIDLEIKWSVFICFRHEMKYLIFFFTHFDIFNKERMTKPSYILIYAGLS